MNMRDVHLFSQYLTKTVSLVTTQCTYPTAHRTHHASSGVKLELDSDDTCKHLCKPALRTVMGNF